MLFVNMFQTILSNIGSSQYCISHTVCYLSNAIIPPEILDLCVLSLRRGQGVMSARVWVSRQ